MEVYAPENQQPVLDRPLEELSLGEAEIANFFSVSTNVDKLIYFLSLEDRKGKDKFDATRFSFFKGVLLKHYFCFRDLMTADFHNRIIS